MPPRDIPLVFHTPCRVPRTALRAFLETISERVAGGRTIACLLTGDAGMRRLNRDFRGKDSATDVLSFPARNGGGFAGDLAISIDRARAQAAEHGHSLDAELRILMLHGALHLSGFDHETDAGQMARAEARWRRRLGLPSGLIERSAARARAEGDRARPARRRLPPPRATREKDARRG